MDINLVYLQTQGWQAIVGREPYNQTSLDVSQPRFRSSPDLRGADFPASLGQGLTCATETEKTECHLGDRVSRNVLECQSLSGDTENSSLNKHISE